MAEINHPYELLKAGENAVLIFTRGRRFDVKSDGTGNTGNWVIRADLDVDTVIIYERQKDRSADIFKALFVGLEGPFESNRYRIRLESIKLIGKPFANWFTFTGKKSSNPIHYLSR